jgi:hypothetical protein
VGVSIRDADGRLLRQEQFCGRVLAVRDGVVVVHRPHAPEDPAVLPADESAYEEAGPGRYVLSTTGETVVDPDYVTTWDVVSQDQPDG